jgi:hypothetical protein
MSKEKRMTSFGVSAPSEADRRHARLPSKNSAVVTTLDQNLQPGPAWYCGIRDLSVSGACLLCADMPCEGDRLIIAIAPTGDSRGAAFYAKIVHVGLLDGEWIRVGVRFLKPDTWIQELLDRAMAELLARAGLNDR